MQLIKDEIEKQFVQAVKPEKLGKLGNTEAAKTALLDWVAKDPISAAVLAILGDRYWDVGPLEEAVKVFKHAVELWPELEAVSLGLFHCLWKLERKNEALDEVKRFMAVSDSDGYREIIQEINGLD